MLKPGLGADQEGANLQVVEADVGPVDVVDGPFRLALAELPQTCAHIADVAIALQQGERAAERSRMDHIICVQEVEVGAVGELGASVAGVGEPAVGLAQHAERKAAVCGEQGVQLGAGALGG